MSTDKPSRNEDEYFAQQNAELLRKQREEADEAALEAERKSHYMKCPKDGFDLASSEFHGVQIETCPHCGGMWLDAGELDRDRPRGTPRSAHARALGRVGRPPQLRQEGRQVTGSVIAGPTEAFSFPGERPVTPEVVREHNLNELEYGRIVEMLGRTPTLTELGVFSALWSEHCSLQALQAGAQDVSDHRPPGGAGAGRERRRAPAPRGVGGRLQDRIPQPPLGGRALSGRRDRRGRHPARCLHHGRSPGRGAQQPAVRAAGPSPEPLPLRRAWCAASATTATASACPRWVARSGFAPGYTGNPLVNAMCVGLLREDDLIRAAAHGVGNVLLAVGARTGRDGIHGASFASEELSEKSEARRPQVQVGDPFTEKLLLEASLELITSGLIVAIQDMGAAGLTSSSAEMAARGGVGVEIDTGAGAHARSRDDPVRDPALGIAGADAGRRGAATGSRRSRRSAPSGSSRATPIGQVTDDGIFRVRHNGLVVAAIPGQRLVDDCPIYTPRRGRADAARARRSARRPPPRRRPISRAPWSSCSTAPTSPASAGSTSSTTRPCRPPPCSARAATPASSGSRAPSSGSR